MELVIVITAIVFLIALIVSPITYYKYIFAGIVVALGILAYNMKPLPTDDLIDHFALIDYFRVTGFSGLFYMIKEIPDRSLMYVYFFIFSFFSKNIYVSVITVMITYGCLFSVLYKLAQRYHIKKLAVILVLIVQLCLINYVYVFSGIRNYLTFSIFVFFLYSEQVEKKYCKFCWIVYIALYLIHSSILLLIIFRIALWFYNKYSKIFILLSLCLWGFLYTIFAQFFNKYFLFETFFSKAEMYFLEAKSGNINKWLMIYIVVIIVLVIIFYINYHLKFNKELNGFYSYISLIFAFTIGSMGQVTLLSRMEALIIMLSGSYLLFYFEQNFEMLKIHSRIKNIFLVDIIRFGLLIILLVISIIVSYYNITIYVYPRLFS